MSKIENIKNHIRENKKAYIGTAAGITVGVGIGAALVKSGDISIVSSGDGKTQIVGKARNVNQVMIELVERSTPSKPVHLEGTNLYFSSLNEAARETGHSISKLSRHINGHIPDLNGDVFKLLDLAD